MVGPLAERDAFQLWIALRILQTFHEKLMLLNLVGTPGMQDPYQRIFGVGSSDKVKVYLQEKRQLLQALATSQDKDEILAKLGPDFLIKINDSSFLLLDTVREVIEALKLDRVIFLFDEAAHTFIPTQQGIFFEMFKLIHGGRVALKAAVYPTVTPYGRNFEVGQDGLVISLDRFEPGATGRMAVRKLFRDLLDRRLPKTGAVRKLQQRRPLGFVHRPVHRKSSRVLASIEPRPRKRILRTGDYAGNAAVRRPRAAAIPSESRQAPP